MLECLEDQKNLKAAEKPEWKIFEQQLLTIIEEQSEFLENLETLIAVCDMLDPVEAWWAPN